MTIKNAPATRTLNLDPMSEGDKEGWAWSKYPTGSISATPLDWVLWAGDSTLDPQPSGFYQASLPTDGDVFYVSTLTGNDSNTGLSREQALQSLAGLAAKMVGREGKDDVILFDCESDFEGTFNGLVMSGKSATRPRVFGFYNAVKAEGRRPRFWRDFVNVNARLYDGYGGPEFVPDYRYLVFTGLDFFSPFKDPDHPEFDPEKSQSLSFYGLRNALFDDCRQMYSSLHIQRKMREMEDPDTKEKYNVYYGPLSGDVEIRRNVFYAAYSNTTSYSTYNRPSHMFVSGCSKFTATENFSDLGGWHPDVEDAGGNSRNHCWYLAENKKDSNGVFYGNLNDFYVGRNIFLRGSSHGCHQRTGGIQEYNFVARCSVGLQVGYNGAPLEPDWIAITRNNVITEGAMQERGILACQPDALCTSAVWGLETAEADNPNGPRYESRNNIVSMLADGEDFRTGNNRGNPIRRAFTPATTLLQSGNIAYKFSNDTEGTSINYKDPTRNFERYFAAHGKALSFEEAAAYLRERPLRAWNPLCTGYAIQEWVRDGFTII